MRTSAPSAFACKRLFLEPGTRMASPKVVKITPGVSASATQSSTRPMGNTHTGQPGPCTSSMASGSMVSIPNLKIACVCPPQTSMMDRGRWLQMAAVIGQQGMHQVPEDVIDGDVAFLDAVNAVGLDDKAVI